MADEGLLHDSGEPKRRLDSARAGCCRTYQACASLARFSHVLIMVSMSIRSHCSPSIVLFTSSTSNCTCRWTSVLFPLNSFLGDSFFGDSRQLPEIRNEPAPPHAKHLLALAIHSMLKCCKAC